MTTYAAPPPSTAGLTAWAEVDLAAIRDNVAALRARSAPGALMAVVKADAYGHGLVPAARAALAGGADYLGTAQLEEAIRLREAGVSAPLLAWLFAPGARLERALELGIEISVASLWALDEVVSASRRSGRQARVHLKVDTGLGRGGALGADWDELVRAVAPLAAEQVVDVVGVFSHFILADAPQHPSVLAQQQTFSDAVRVLERGGVRPQLRHLANSAATLTNPDAHLDMVRPGLAVYGLSPVPGIGRPEDFGLREAMRLMTRAVLVKDVPAGQGLSYGHTYTTATDTTVALIPMGYGDGIPRSASNAGPVVIGGERLQVSGRVCMDQFVVDTHGRVEVAAGDPVVLWGRGGDGEPTAEDWAQACSTISYEIVTRLGGRVPRVLLGGEVLG